MSRPNLKIFNLVEVRFNFEAKITDELSKRLEAFPADRDGDYVFFDSYKSERIGHIANAVVSLLNKSENGFGFSFLYRLGRGGRLRKDLPRISDLFEVISAIRERVEYDCLLRFQFGRRLKPKTLIDLPLKVTGQENVPFNEIRGVHFVKREKGEVKYDVILDLFDGGGLMNTVLFKHKDKIDESVVGKIIQNGLEISKSFASRE